MIFENYRRRRWNSKLQQAIKKADALDAAFRSLEPLYGMDKMSIMNRLVYQRGLIGKYKGLLEIGDDQLENEIQKILKK